MNPLELSPEEFEVHVKRMLEEEGLEPSSFHAQHLERIPGTDGDYEFDVTVRFKALNVDFLVLVECKRHTCPIKRELVQVFFQKLQSVGAQKGILFATTNFQRGAIEFAQKHCIALVTVQDGKKAYRTKAQSPPDYHPPWLPAFVGYKVYLSDEGSESLSLVGKIVIPGRDFKGDGKLLQFILGDPN